jgi:hypothetical protein
MTELLVIKERLKKAYTTYGTYIDAAARGLLVFAACVAVNSLIGYMPLLQSPFIVLLLAIIGAFLPSAAAWLIVSLVILGNLFSVTLEAALLFVVLEMLFVLTYFVLKPGNSHVLVLSAALGALQFFGPLPMILGLLYTPVALVPMTFGLVISQYMSYIADNYVLLSNKTSTLSNIQKISQIATGVGTSERLWTMVVILVLVSLLVYGIRRLQVRNSWFYAIVVGVLAHLLLTLLGDFMFDIRENYFIFVINLILEVLVGLVLWFFFFMVDYSREENLQFEDDDYYYYVKAIPKITVTVPEVRVTRIRERNVKDTARTMGQVTFVMDDREDETVDVEEEEDV